MFLATTMALLRARPGVAGDPRPVSVLIPVGRQAPMLAATVAAVQAQAAEILICVTAANAGGVVVGPGCRLVVGAPVGAASPKLDALAAGLAAAAHDLVCVLDANMLLAPGQLAAALGWLVPGVGLVTTGPIGTAPEGLAGRIEAAFLNFYQARYILAAASCGADYGMGAFMLFSRAAFGRAGGIAAIAGTVAEDRALQMAFARLGQRTRIHPAMARQAIGARRFAQVWHRQLRWMVIRRVEALPAFLIEPFLATAATVAAGMAGAPALGLSPWLVGGGTLVGWYLIEATATSWLRRTRPSWHLPPFHLGSALAREALLIALWLRALATRHVLWDGVSLPVRPGTGQKG